MLILIMGLYASWVHAISNEISVLISLQVVSLKDNNWLEMEQIRKAPGLILKIQSKKKKKRGSRPTSTGHFSPRATGRPHGMWPCHETWINDLGVAERLIFVRLRCIILLYMNTHKDGYTSVSCWTVECEHSSHKTDLVLIFLITLKIMSVILQACVWKLHHWHKCCYIRLVLAG